MNNRPGWNTAEKSHSILFFSQPFLIIGYAFLRCCENCRNAFFTREIISRINMLGVIKFNPTYVERQI